jgi:hypothetical protein
MQRAVFMRNLLTRALFAASSIASLYLISGSHVRADDWGCQVILCISNPGGPTQYDECKPAIHKLWSELAKGHSFPTCNSVGLRISQPGYEPHYCGPGYRLIRSYGVRGQEVSCVSTAPQKLDDAFCSYGHNNYLSTDGGVTSAGWQRHDGRLQCFGQMTVRPTVRERPHFIDVTVHGAGTQRVWY